MSSTKTTNQTPEKNTISRKAISWKLENHTIGDIWIYRYIDTHDLLEVQWR